MTTIPYNPTEIKALREELSRYNIEVSSKTLWELLRLVGNRSVCVDALLMVPRPAWLEKLAGPIVDKSGEKTQQKSK